MWVRMVESNFLPVNTLTTTLRDDRLPFSLAARLPFGGVFHLLDAVSGTEGAHD